MIIKIKIILTTINFDQYLNGLRVEMRKRFRFMTLEKAKKVVAKNLEKDPIYYTKNAAFKVEGLGYEQLDLPGLTPKETNW